jgi:hypothetical protein
MPFLTLHLGEKVSVYTDTNNQNVVDLSNANILLTNDCAQLNANNVINKGYVDSEITKVTNLIGGADLQPLMDVVTMFHNYQVDSSDNLVSLITELGSDIKIDLSSEILRATSAEDLLRSDLSTEISDARAAETSIDNRLSTEISDARAAELVLTNNLSTEVSDARAAELVLTNNLSSEVAQLTSAAYHPIIVPLNPSIIGGQAYPTFMPSPILALSYDGWYYKKTLTDSVNNKINWYLGPSVNMNVGSIYQLFFEMFLIKNASLPFITVYTKPDALTPNAGGWYKSKRTFEVLNTTLSENTQYCCSMKFNSSIADPVSYGHIVQNMSNSDVVANIKGNFDASEQVMFFAFGSNSSSAVGNVEFICKSVKIQTASGTASFLFSNAQVMNYAMQNDISSEVSTARAAELVLRGDLSTEVSDARAAESSLKSDIDAEIINRGVADNTLQSNIDTEIINRGVADNTLQANIDNEYNRANTAESGLRTDLTSEITNRQAAVSDEYNRAILAETSLENALASEISKARSTEVDLLARIDALYFYFFKKNSNANSPFI